MKFINSPYIWGGRIPSGIDCSGFVQLVYKIRGIKIPRDSWQQAGAGESVGFIDECVPGDLVLLDDNMGKITHVGMILAQGLVIHASGGGGLTLLIIRVFTRMKSGGIRTS